MSMSASRRLGYLLIASLAVNLFLGGLYAGQWLEGWHRGPDGGGPVPLRFHLGAFVDRLPEASQDQARQVLRRHRAEIGSAIRGVREARREIGAALRAEPFVPEDLEAALADLRGRAGDVQLAMHQAMLELASKLSPEARRALADGMARPRHRGAGPGR